MGLLSRLNNPKPNKGKSAPPKDSGKPKDSKPPRGKKNAPPPPQGLTLDQKLDIVGICLVLAGLIIIFAFLSPNNSNFTKPILTLLAQLFGLGKYLAPVGLIVLGGWIVLRHFGDKLPRVEPERVLGYILLFVVALVSIHFFVAQTPEDGRTLAEAGEGGGWIGHGLLQILLTSLGTGGAVVAVAAWWIIAAILALGLSMQQLITGAQTAIETLRVRPRQNFEPTRPPLTMRPPTPARPEPDAPPVEPARPTLAPAPKQSSQSQPASPAQGKKQRPQQPTAQPAIEIPPPPPSPMFDQPLIIGGQQPWVLPAVADMLEPGSEAGADDQYDRERVRTIEDTLSAFGAPSRVVEINRGPTITQFGVEPDYVDVRGKKTKVKVGKIASLSDDLALALAAPSIRIEAPVPGKGYVGIEVPNVETTVVALRDVMENENFRRFKTTLGLALGQDVSGQAVSADLTNMPHLLIAGTTGSGKSVCVNSIIACLLLQNTPDDLKFLMVDPKRVELTSYNGIPHLLTPVVVEMERVVNSLQWVTREMDERYRKFAKAGTRNINEYNKRVETTGEKKIPYLIVIIDELADLMMLAPDETEKTITRLAQMARATGIHLVIATQRPSVDVVTGLIKANFPARIAFAVASSVDSRVILDQPGAEKLLGRGDMLFQSPDASQPLRMQGVFVSDAEIQRVVRYWKGARGIDETTPAPAEAVPATSAGSGMAAKQQPLWEELRESELRAEGEDDLLEESIKVVREMRKASITLLQRRLRIGYTRAARLIDLLEEKGIIGPAKTGAQQREVVGYSDGTINPTGAEADADAERTRRWSAEE
ncbi:MAG: DNA translocase FtsK 4TM domain-containing protein [Chloroflexi bacterium]|nr:DNA translocase FtsK 4TM domain-containing protein [Chloroflexota bacterium]